MDDKTRILMAIIRDLYLTGDWVRAPDHRGARFAPLHKPEVGTLVLCLTSSGFPHDFTVGFVKAVRGAGECDIREIGSDRVCRVSNERFIPIEGANPPDLWEGAKYEFYFKVLKAFKKGDEWDYRFSGLGFDENSATIEIRARYGGLSRPLKPFTITMKWNRRTTIKAILETLRAGGYGTHKYEVDTEAEARGEGRSYG